MNKNGFTLLEMMIASFVIVVGLTAVVTLMLRAAVSVQSASSRLTAVYLAQEGLEIVRNIRDSNWLAQRDNPGILWDQNISLCSTCQADFDDPALTRYFGSRLRINGGFYNYTSGANTKFTRLIIITTLTDTLQVSVRVRWVEKGVSQIVSVDEHLYNWR
jgi:prepilin-type N-terminal cleavage/methylation domain-containing protein